MGQGGVGAKGIGQEGMGRSKKNKTKTKRLVSAARQRNASSLTSLRPVPYTLHSFLCSNVDGLQP